MISRKWYLALAIVLAGSRAALAGPPYITDDPEPTDTGHWENYLYTERARVSGAAGIQEAGVEVNYGALPDVQLTWAFPLNPNPGLGGMGVVWAPLGGGVKYRFIEEDEDGWRPQVAFFPQVSIPIGAAARGAPVTELLPIWMQKSFGAWTMFGGGGYTNNPGPGNRDFANYGFAVQNQVTDNLALGAEIFGQGSDSLDDHPATAVGMALLYDFSPLWHLVGSANTGIAHGPQSDQFSYNFALKWTP
jgi:hypothetical protein